MKHRRSFAIELKRQVVEELLSGMSTPAQLMLRYEISSGHMMHLEGTIVLLTVGRTDS